MFIGLKKYKFLKLGFTYDRKEFLKMYISKERYEQLMRLAFHDAKTGFYNRNWFLDEYLPNLEDEKLNIAIVDINYLKKVNDEQGHFAGDKLIKDIGDKLSEFSTVVRWGGDEFYCLIEKENVENFKEICKNQFDFAYALKENFESKDIIKVIEEADKEMYKCKRLQKCNRNRNLDPEIVVNSSFKIGGLIDADDEI